MKLTVVIVCLLVAICVNGAPQAGPPLGLPPDSYAPHCRSAPCPSSGIVNITFPLDCLEYVACNNGVASVTACPPNLFWHEAAGKCDESKIANCRECWR